MPEKTDRPFWSQNGCWFVAHWNELGDGDYDIVISAACDEAKGEKAKFTVTVDGQAVGAEVTCTTTDAKDYVVKAPGLKAGEHKIAIEFLNDVYKENEYDLNLYVHGVTLQPVK